VAGPRRADELRRRAVELELAVKHSSRMQAIVHAYADGLVFDQVLWLVEQPAHRARVQAIANELGTSQNVMAWQSQSAVAAALAPFDGRASDPLEDALPAAIAPRDEPRHPAAAVPTRAESAADDELFDDDFVFGTR
jgi:hypothetical protein